MKLETSFAPAERAPQDEIRRQHEKLAGLPYVRDFLDAVPDMAMVLNGQRQIVFANQAFTDFLRLTGDGQPPGKKSGDAFGSLAGQALGQRFGEAIGCLRSYLTVGGCGTTPFCRTCGAVISILKSQKLHAPSVQECRMTCDEAGRPGGQMDLRVWARPITVAGEEFTVFSVVDVSDEKRRQALERIFFHDVTNTAGCVRGLAEILTQSGVSEAENREMAGMILETSDQLLEEIGAQQVLAAAERGELQPAMQAVSSRELLAQIQRQFHAHNLAKDKKIVVAEDAAAVVMVTDPVLLRRVLINLVKNALEATAAGGIITLNAHRDGELVAFTVHNAAVMPPQVQTQLFSRSFSTKGKGRGLGTYSIKLLTEKYLHGNVSFISNTATGTRFTVRYPSVLPAA
jgi:hypothetical protein